MPEITILIENNYCTTLKNIIPTVKKSLYAIIYIAYPHLKRSHDDVKLILDEIIHATHKGIDVKILFNSIETKNLVSRANKISFDYLRKEGVLVKTTEKGRNTHSKLFLIDDNTTITGSHNLSNTSLHQSREISILIKDEKTNQELKEYFLKNFYEAKN
jgi:phosphatidylserine/phosphatidylglycerophosphate/cardiolipin synthase-like enzyme